MEKIWIRNAVLVDGSSSFKGELILADGKIAEVGESLDQPQGEVRVVDAGGKFVFPGALDPHVHLELPTPAGPSSDDFLSGTAAALLGGTTSIIDFVTPARGQNLTEALKERRLCAEKSLIDYTFHLGLSDWHDGSAAEMSECARQFGIRSFKAYLAYRNTIGVDYNELQEIMNTARDLDAVVCVHCEEGPAIEALQKEFLSKGCTTPKYHALSRPPQIESDAVDEVIRLCAETGCMVYLVHISTAASVAAIAKARRRNLNLAAETCPQYLLLDESLYDQPLPGSLAYIMSPPLRRKADQESLWKALKQGDIEVVSTDHCPFNIKGQKDVGLHDFTLVPNGGAGIETRLKLLYTYGVLSGRFSMEAFVEMVSVAPARIFGLWPRKGALVPGADADVVIWDPDYKEVISVSNLSQHCDHTPFEGMNVSGRPEMVICGGSIAVDHGQLNPFGLKGRFLARK